MYGKKKMMGGGKVKKYKDKMMGGGKVKKYKDGGAITQQQEMAMGKTSKSSKSNKGKKSKGGCQNRLYM
jgi:hypothetical protein